MQKKVNNAESTLAWNLQASNTTSFIIKTWEGDSFWTEFPLDITLEQYSWNTVVKREIIRVWSRSWDVFNIDSRAVQACVQNDSANPKTRTQDALSFDSWDRVFVWFTEDDINFIIDELSTNIPDTYATKDEVKKSELVYGASSTGTDDYEITVSWITTYQDGMTFRVKSDVANTGACTLDVNGIWAKAVKKQQWTVDLTDGDWAANWIATLVYNSSLDVWQYASQEAVVVSPNVSSTSIDFVYGESIDAWDIVKVSEEVLDLNLFQYEASVNEFRIWYNTTDYAVWQSCTFKTNWLISRLKIPIIKIWTPTFDLKVDVYEWNTSTLIWTSDLVNATSFSSWDDVEFNFTTKPTVSTWTTYFIKISPSSTSTTNYCETSYIQTSPSPSWQAYEVNSSNSWSAFSLRDLRIDVYVEEVSLWKLIKASALNNTKNKLWIAKTSWNLDDIWTIDIWGVNSNQTWLTSQEKYYLSNTPWQISTTPWDYVKFVWEAVSSTELQINQFDLRLKKINSISHWVTYTADYDGFVYWYIQYSNNYVSWYVNGWLVARDDTGENSWYASICFPVRQWEDYMVDTEWGSPSQFNFKFIQLNT